MRLLTVYLTPLLLAADRYEFAEPAMGTQVKVVVYADTKPAAVNGARAAFKRVRDLEAVLSDYKNSSETMQLCLANDADPGKPRPVGDDLAKVLGVALGVSAKSGGAFDVTVGPLSKLWRETRKTKQLPAPEQLAAAKAVVGYKLVTLDAAKKTVTLAKPGMRLDFGGIGKGFAADEALKVLKDAGLPSAMVALSGDIAVGDAPPGKSSWELEIAAIGTGKPGRTVYLSNAAVSTSGDLYQFVEIGGVRYSHVLDPKTGLGLTGRRSVTVIAKQGILSDAYSKAASLLLPEKAVPLVEALPGGAAYIVVKESDSAGEQITASLRFTDYSTPPK